MTPDAAKPWLAPDAPTAEGAHRVLWFQDHAGRRLPVAVTPAGDTVVLQIGANPTVALTLHRDGAGELGALLVLLARGRTVPDLAAPTFDQVCATCARPIEHGKAIATDAGPIHAACWQGHWICASCNEPILSDDRFAAYERKDGRHHSTCWEGRHSRPASDPAGNAAIDELEADIQAAGWRFEGAGLDIAGQDTDGEDAPVDLGDYVIIEPTLDGEAQP